jgi:hypothetical protein
MPEMWHFQYHRRLFPNHGQTGSYSESEGSLGHSGLPSPGLFALPEKWGLVPKWKDLGHFSMRRCGNGSEGRSAEIDKAFRPKNQNRSTIPVENLKLFCEPPLNCVNK